MQCPRCQAENRAGRRFCGEVLNGGRRETEVRFSLPTLVRGRYDPRQSGGRQ
jgi:hypothetical protein